MEETYINRVEGIYTQKRTHFNTCLLRTKRIYDLSSKMSFPVPPQELQERPEEHFVQ